MLVRFKRINRVLAVPLLGVFAGSLVPSGARAQTPAPQPAAAGKRAVLFVPLQRSEHVAESVPPRVEEYLRALVEIDPSIRLVTLPPEAWKAPEETAGAPAGPEPVRENPVLQKARNLAESGRSAVQKRRFEAGLLQLMNAEKLFRGQLAELEDFDQYVDVLVWIAAGLVLGGFREEAGSALRNLVSVRPDIALPAAEFDRRFIEAVEGAKGRLARGGSLAVQVNDETATVYVDGRLVGQGNQTVQDLVQGRHFVRVTAPGMRPQGRFVTVGNKTATASFQFKQAKPKQVAKRPARPLTEYARTGDYDAAFVQDVREAVEKASAEFAVLGYIARSDTAYHIGLFLFEARGARVAGIEPAVVDTDLTNLQIALLELESRLARAVERFPDDRVVRARPALYAIAPTQRPVAVPAPVPVAPPATTTAPTAPAPPTSTPPAPTVAATQPSGAFEDIPPDFPMETLPGREPSQPWYKKWWVWTAIGGAAAVALGVGLGVGLGKGGGGGGPSTFGANVRW